MTPIKTIITNKSPVSKTVYWAGKETLWLQGNAKTEVPFELWSVAEDHQKTAICSSIRDGQIELALAVLGSNGEYTTVEFNPLGKIEDQPVVKQASAPKVMDTTKQQVAELDHTVRVTSTETATMLEGLGAKKVTSADDDPLPPRELKNGEPEQVEETPAEEPKEEAPKKRRAKKAE